MKYPAKRYRQFRFSQKFFRYLLIRRVAIQKDNIVLVTGSRGIGKSTLAINMAMGLSNAEKIKNEYTKFVAKFHPKEKIEDHSNEINPFNMERDIVFTSDGLHDLCKNSKMGFIVADEAIVSTGRRNSMTKANKILHRILTINRKNCNTIFFLLPSVEDFDVSILQYVSHWVHVEDRGAAIVFLKGKPSVFGRKAWDLDKMRKTYDKFKDDNPTVARPPFWLFDNFRGKMKFGPMNIAVEEKYLKLAFEKKNKQDEEEELAKLKKSAKGDAKINPKIEILNSIVDELLSGKIYDTADYYAYCSKTEMTKAKMNKLANEILARRGDGRNALRVIKENKEHKDDKIAENMKIRKIIY